MNKYLLNKVTLLVLLLSFLIISPSKSQAVSYTLSLVPNCTSTVGTNPEGVSCSSKTRTKFSNKIDTREERIDVQRLLNRILILASHLTTDGIFGKKTISAIRAFQTIYNLKVDGVVGPQTITALEQAETTPDSNTPPSTPTPPTSLIWTDELMQNGGFESGNLSGWTTSGTNWKVGFDVPNGSAGCQAGIYCAYASTPSSPNGYIYQDVNLTPYVNDIDSGKAIFL